MSNRETGWSEKNEKKIKKMGKERRRRKRLDDANKRRSGCKEGRKSGVRRRGEEGKTRR